MQAVNETYVREQLVHGVRVSNSSLYINFSHSCLNQYPNLIHLFDVIKAIKGEEQIRLETGDWKLKVLGGSFEAPSDALRPSTIGKLGRVGSGKTIIRLITFKSFNSTPSPSKPPSPTIIQCLR